MAESIANKLDRMFNPRSVAVVGDKQTLGHLFNKSNLRIRERLRNG